MKIRKTNLKIKKMKIGKTNLKIRTRAHLLSCLTTIRVIMGHLIVSFHYLKKNDILCLIVEGWLSWLGVNLLKGWSDKWWKSSCGQVLWRMMRVIANRWQLTVQIWKFWHFENLTNLNFFTFWILWHFEYFKRFENLKKKKDASDCKIVVRWPS